MNILFLNLFCAFAFLQKSSAFLHGFPKEQCDEMDPTKIKLPPSKASKGGSSGEMDDNSTDFVSEDAPPTSIQLSGSLNLYRIVTSSPKYRRGRTLDITIRGPEFNALMLQVRKIGADERRGVEKPVRVGEFVSWPASLQPVTCDKDEKTALTNKNYAQKSGIVVKWKAPKDDVGDIHIVARFIAGDEYWQLTESREIPMNEFPVNLKNCGKAKSCVLYSEKSASCHEDNCDYILTYSVLNSTSVEFVLGGSAAHAEQNNYLAIGFSDTPQGENLKMIACTKAKTVAEIKYFVLKSVEEGPVEAPMNLEGKNIDLDGERMWCSFVAPMVTTSEEGEGLDLSIPLYHAYMRGTTNNTRGTNVPILPAKIVMSKKEIQLDKIKLQYHTMEKQNNQQSSSEIPQTMFLLIAVSCLFVKLQQRLV